MWCGRLEYPSPGLDHGVDRREEARLDTTSLAGKTQRAFGHSAPYLINDENMQ
jgi:hypothetical protein